MVGRSEAMQRVYQLVDMVAPTRARVVISGERGTGKELVARAIHALSPRREKPFVQLNCAAVPAELIESEMFGHVKGAFTGAVADRRGTFESADGGTLFLDEIGDMSTVMQVKLLRTLQEGEVTPVGSSRSRPVDVRILAATSKNLLEEIEKKHASGTTSTTVSTWSTSPCRPLRSRSEDVPLLAEHYIRLASVENGIKPKRLTPRALEFLSQLPWRGNVREVRNLMERLAVIVAGDTVTPPRRHGRTAHDGTRLVGRRDADAPARWPGHGSSGSTSSSGWLPTRATSGTRPATSASSGRTCTAR